MYLNDCDETIDVIRRSGAEVLAEPADQPWRERIARVADPDGNEIIVGSSSG
jgi:predicted enzyme related to lactoylglutathione lyase